MKSPILFENNWRDKMKNKKYVKINSIDKKDIWLQIKNGFSEQSYDEKAIDKLNHIYVNSTTEEKKLINSIFIFLTGWSYEIHLKRAKGFKDHEPISFS